MKKLYYFKKQKSGAQSCRDKRTQFLCQMEPFDEQKPREAVVRYDCDEVVDGRDERAILLLTVLYHVDYRQ